jgi:hypothetical protein
VQQHPDDRPSMATVVWMLGGENTLPQPKEPGFFKGSGPFGPSSSSSNIELSSKMKLLPHSFILGSLCCKKLIYKEQINVYEPRKRTKNKEQSLYS